VPDWCFVEIGALECEVEYEYEAECGDGWHEPRTPADAYVTDIKVQGVSIMDIWDALPMKEQDRIAEVCLKHHGEMVEDMKAEAAIAAYEMRMEA